MDKLDNGQVPPTRLLPTLSPGTAVCWRFRAQLPPLWSPLAAQASGQTVRGPAMGEVSETAPQRDLMGQTGALLARTTHSVAQKALRSVWVPQFLMIPHVRRLGAHLVAASVEQTAVLLPLSRLHTRPG